MLADQLHHRGARPRFGEIDRRARDVDDGVAAERGARGRDHQVLGELHHLVVVTKRLVRLEHRELGVVAGVDALVAEHAADLEHPLEAADDEPLQVQLERDAEVEVDVECVVVGHERPGRRAAELVVQHRRLDFYEAAVAERAPDGGDRGEAHCEHPAGIGRSR